MNVKILNCNNIDEANIEIREGTLNLKYAANGTGKSTVASAIVSSVQGNKEALATLQPFKYRDGVGEHVPSVTGLERVESVKVFDEHYVLDFVFKPIVAEEGSFEIFVKPPDYDKQMAQIGKMLHKISRVFQDDRALDELILVCQRFVEGFGKSSKGYSNSGLVLKGLSHGNKVANIPEGLEPYKAYLQSEHNVKWLKWQAEGRGYQGIDVNYCPFCTNGITSVKSRIDKLSTEFDAKTVENLSKTIDIFNSLSVYLSPDTAARLSSISRDVAGIEESMVFLLEIKEQAQLLQDKLLSLKSLSYVTLKDVEEVSDELEGRKLKEEDFSHFRSIRVNAKINEVNQSIGAALETAGALKGAVIRQRRLVERTIQENKVRFDNFLQSAGYRYEVSIKETDNGSFKAIISHLDCRNMGIVDVKRHFSYGERNAFALAMFMFDAVHQNPDLIILDDPISSFDGNKKFALFNIWVAD